MSEFKGTPGPWVYDPSGPVMAGYSQPFGVHQLGKPNLVGGCFGDVGCSTVSRRHRKSTGATAMTVPTVTKAAALAELQYLQTQHAETVKRLLAERAELDMEVAALKVDLRVTREDRDSLKVGALKWRQLERDTELTAEDLVDGTGHIVRTRSCIFDDFIPLRMTTRRRISDIESVPVVLKLMGVELVYEVEEGE